MAFLAFQSPDGRYGLCVSEEHTRTILELCARAGEAETGGILIGHYSDDLACAIVTRVTGPSEDSRAGGTWFQRGARYLRELLARSWHRGQGYYLGEWHFHPSAPPTPSSTDERTMRRISEDAGAACAQPVLLIIGGTPPGRWDSSARVYPRRGPVVQLTPSAAARASPPSTPLVDGMPG